MASWFSMVQVGDAVVLVSRENVVRNDETPVGSTIEKNLVRPEKRMKRVFFCPETFVVPNILRKEVRSMKGFWGYRKPYGPPPWWEEEAPRWGWWWGGPTKSERKEWLEALKKHLEERLEEVNEELKKLEE